MHESFWLLILTLIYSDIKILNVLALRERQVPQNRLTWPALLEHPFVKETSDEMEARVMIYHSCISFKYQNLEKKYKAGVIIIWQRFFLAPFIL